jgi:hypothetical protein
MPASGRLALRKIRHRRRDAAGPASETLAYIKKNNERI